MNTEEGDIEDQEGETDFHEGGAGVRPEGKVQGGVHLGWIPEEVKIQVQKEEDHEVEVQAMVN